LYQEVPEPKGAVTIQPFPDLEAEGNLSPMCPNYPAAPVDEAVHTMAQRIAS
jgi:hypothetical protein